MFGGFADFTFAGQEDQHVAGLLVPEFVDGRFDGRRKIGFVVLILAGRFFGCAVAHFHRIETAGDFDDGGRFAGLAEVFGEAGGIDGGGGDDEFEVIPPGAIDELLEVAQQKIDVEAAFVGLVDDEGVVGGQQAVALAFGQQDAVGHQLDAGAGGDLFVEAYLVADVGAQRGTHFFGDAGGHAAGGDAAWLGMADEAAAACPAVAGRTTGFEAELGQLGGLAGAGFAGDDDDAMIADGIDDAVTVFGDGERVDDGLDGGGNGAGRHGLGGRLGSRFRGLGGCRVHGGDYREAGDPCRRNFGVGKASRGEVLDHGGQPRGGPCAAKGGFGPGFAEDGSG